MQGWKTDNCLIFYKQCKTSPSDINIIQLKGKESSYSKVDSNGKEKELMHYLDQSEAKC